MEWICSVFVLPLAGRPSEELWVRRWPDEPHLRVLTKLLGLKFTVHDVYSELYRKAFGDAGPAPCGFEFHMLFDGSHFELMYK